MPSHKQKALLHIAKAQLGLSEEEYREVLKNHGGAESSIHLSDFGFERVMHFFARLGFKKRAALRAAPSGDFASEKQKKMILHLAEDLGWSPSRLFGFARKMTGLGSLDGLSPKSAQRLIEALKAMRDRAVGWN